MSGWMMRDGRTIDERGAVEALRFVENEIRCGWRLAAAERRAGRLNLARQMWRDLDTMLELRRMLLGRKHG